MSWTIAQMKIPRMNCKEKKMRKYGEYVADRKEIARLNAGLVEVFWRANILGFVN